MLEHFVDSNRTWSELTHGVPTFWVNDRRQASPDAGLPTRLADIHAAASRWRRFEPVLARLFPESIPQGVIESPLVPIPRLARYAISRRAPGNAVDRMFVKADHDLPVAGSVKARGGIYEVLCLAERIALSEGIIANEDDDYGKLLTANSRQLFGSHDLVVASTGNLGYAVGSAGRAFGFSTTIHMSHDAKPWKKARLRAIGAQVIEHGADYSTAVEIARKSVSHRERTHFVDDERSMDLFLGYAVAALRLIKQLARAGIRSDAQRPLCLYLPCGVGGAPGGILFGLRLLLGESALGFFAEPTVSPCMLMRLLNRLPNRASVYDIGLSNRTEADGLAVARASELVVRHIGSQIAGAYTVSDDELLRWVAAAHEHERLRLEPSAAAGFAGALRGIWESDITGLDRDAIRDATHIIWTTGGGLVPEQEFSALLARAINQSP